MSRKLTHDEVALLVEFRRLACRRMRRQGAGDVISVWLKLDEVAPWPEKRRKAERMLGALVRHSYIAREMFAIERRGEAPTPCAGYRLTFRGLSAADAVCAYARIRRR